MLVEGLFLAIVHVEKVKKVCHDYAHFFILVHRFVKA